MEKIIMKICFVLIGGFCLAQNNQAVDISLGYEPNGYLGKFSYGRYYGIKNMVRVSGQYNIETYEFGEIQEDVSVNLFLANLEYYYSILDVNGRDFVAYIGLGGFGGYEDISESILSNGAAIVEESGIVYGGHIGLELEKYLVQLDRSGVSLAIISNIRQNYFLKSSLGDSQLNASLGFRVNF